MGRPAKLLLSILLVAGAFLAGTWYARKGQEVKAAPGRRILYYYDPMHPSYKSDKPGIAPDCGMRLEPFYAGEDGSEAVTQPVPVQAGAVHLSLEKQQIAGVRSAEVTRSSAAHVFRVSGRVTLDETRVFRVTTAVDGLVRQAAPIVTGSIIRKDELLGNFYNRDFLTAQQTYLYALNTMDRFKNDEESAEQLKVTEAQMRAAEENLEFLGMGETQRREIARTRQIAREIDLRSPVAGVVLARNTFAGQRFERGTELFRVADIAHVWVLADLFGTEMRYVHSGQRATVILPDQGKSFAAVFSETLPQYDSTSRTLKARLELDNPGYALRPDMFVDIEFTVGLPSAVHVPVDAVIDSGRTKTVYVAKEGGTFEPRLVETGWRLGDQVEIVSGLEPGDRVVVSGNFMLDSESRMKAAERGGGMKVQQASLASGSPQDPVCGMDVNPASAMGRSEYKGKTYYFCSDRCKRQFAGSPEAFIH